MSVDTGVSGSTSQILAVAVWDMLPRFRVSESLGEAEVNNIHIMLLLANTNQKVVWLDVSMQEVATVDELNSLQLKKLETLGHLPFGQQA